MQFYIIYKVIHVAWEVNLKLIKRLLRAVYDNLNQNVRMFPRFGIHSLVTLSREFAKRHRTSHSELQLGRHHEEIKILPVRQHNLRVLSPIIYTLVKRFSITKSLCIKCYRNSNVRHRHPPAI